MNYNDKFEKDKKDGELGEKLFAEFMEGKGYKALHFNKDINYDILFEKEGRKIKFEIKTDRWEYFNRVTNNMFIEAFCNGKVSGISATKADYFAYFYPDQEIVYVIKVRKLRNLILTRPDLFRRTERAGDGGRVTGYLFNKNNNEDFFRTHIIKISEKWFQ